MDLENTTTVQITVNGADAPGTWARGTKLFDILGRIAPNNLPYVAALYNNAVTALDRRAELCGTLQGLTAADREGYRVIQRSLCFLLAKSFARCYPGREFRIHHTIGNGLFCTIGSFADTDGDGTVDAEVLETLDAEMRRTVAALLPIRTGAVGYMEALELFEATGQTDKVNLLRHRNSPAVALLMCEDYCELYQGPVVVNTGFLSVFKLVPCEMGFLLQMPDPQNPTVVAETIPRPHLIRIHREHIEWGRILDVQTAGQLNEAVRTKRVSEVIQMSEALHDKKLAQIADAIAERRDEIKMVLIAGPSSAGKTTSSKRLSTHIRVNGLRPIVLALDDYFVEESRDPLDENGNPDYEHIEAIDLEALNRDLCALLAGESIPRRVYNFRAKMPTYKDERISLGKDGIIVMEGLHGLNPRLTEMIPRERKFLVYLSTLTQLGLDNSHCISTSDNRLLRRMVRDNQFRGHDALKTLRMWPDVRRGEERWIFPFQDSADATFNSSLDYELAVLRTFAEPLLMDVKPNQPEYATARRLLEFLRNFFAIPADMVPNDSLLREFIGGSLLKY